jgi:hypothetical protein
LKQASFTAVAVSVEPRHQNRTKSAQGPASQRPAALQHNGQHQPCS